MGLLVILLVVGLLAAGSYLLYGRPRSSDRLEEQPEPSMHLKDEVLDDWAAADDYRNVSGNGFGGGWG